jgi:curved DNA-binding protein CbpA
MKLDSKYFDSIRVAPKRDRERPEAPEEREAHGPCCEWKGCTHPGRYRAPKGRGRDGQYYLFCIDHVRQYNASYNYFDGMSDAQVEEFQKDALTGHRPTWKVGANSWAHGTRAGAAGSAGAHATGPARSHDPHGFFAWRAKRAREEPAEQRRQLRPLERKSLHAMHLPDNATKAEIKARFKELVKRHHPDANGGDSRSADTLREIIQAYNYLKQAGLA